jgi:DNA transposition AAA+ family ATPase
LENSFKRAKEVFKDVVDLNLYVPLSNIEKTKKDLLTAIDQKEKMIFISAEAGRGKSVILRSVYEVLKYKSKGFLISNPYLEIDSILALLKQLSLNEHQIFLIDEAQLLSAETFENLRIYADRGNITLVFATHDTNLKKLLKKKHFKTRVNYVLTIQKASKEDIETFIRSKLIKADLLEISEMITKKNYNLIYRYTKGSS